MNDAIKQALEAAYLAGFNASGEGYNGEYPFQCYKRDPEQDEEWVGCRDAYVKKALAEQPVQQRTDYAVHLHHCNMGEWEGACKYGDPDCPALAHAALKAKLKPTQPKGCQCAACKITPHASDCPVHNEPAWPNGPCDCGAQPEQPEYRAVKTWHDGKPVYVAEQPTQQQEPAGSVYRYGRDSSGKPWHGIRWTASGLDLPDGTLIYTSPQPSKPWVGLTDDERRGLREWQKIQEELGPVWAPMMLYLYEAIEAKLKEKNNV